MERENRCDNTATDAKLLARFVGKRDERAFTALVHRYQRLVWSVCARSLSNRCDVEDAFQTTFMLLASRAHRIYRPESLANWLYGTAWKTAARIRRNRLTESLDDPFEIVGSAEEPFQLIAKKHEIELVDRQLRSMNEKFRTPLILFYFVGLSAREIANQLDISLSAAEGRLRRARAQLRFRLASRGMVASPMALSAWLMPSWPTDTAFIAMTTERCFTTGAGTFPAMTTGTLSAGNLSVGAKLMIIKCILSVAIISLLAVGGLFHQSATEQTAAQSQEILAGDVIPPQNSEVELALQDDETDAERHHRAMMVLHHHFHQLHVHLHHWLLQLHGHGTHGHGSHGPDQNGHRPHGHGDQHHQ